jgi:periplasmic copper chaperone A
MRLSFAAVLLLAACATAPAPAIQLPGPAIVLASPETGPDSQVAAYVRIVSTGPADRLIGVSCACAETSEIHETANRAMHTLQSLNVPAGGAIDIRPGGPTHLMLMNLRAPIVAGERVPITLTFERAGAITSDFTAVTSSREAWPPEPRS